MRIYQPFKEADEKIARQKAVRKIVFETSYLALVGIGLYLVALVLWFGLAPLGEL